MRNDYPQKMPTPVKPEILKAYLEGYEQDLANYLISGFTYGFQLGCLNTPSSTPPKTMGQLINILKLFLTKLRKNKVMVEYPRHLQIPNTLIWSSPLWEWSLKKLKANFV